MVTFAEVGARSLPVEPNSDVTEIWDRNGYRWYHLRDGGWLCWRVSGGAWRFQPYRVLRQGMNAVAPSSLFDRRAEILPQERAVRRRVMEQLGVEDEELDLHTLLQDVIDEENRKAQEEGGADTKLMERAATAQLALTAIAGGYLLIYPESYIERMLAHTEAVTRRREVA